MNISGFKVLCISIFLPVIGWAQVSQNFLDQQPPVYEIGMGVITLNIPDYPGSDNNQFRVIPFPYGIYRGEYLRADDEGTRARLLSSKRHEMGLSFGFNFPVKSENNPSRAGMQDLDAILALGPRILYRLIPGDENHRLNFQFAVRAVFSSNFGNRFRSEGLDFEPSFSYWYRWRKINTTFFSNLSFEFGSSKLNNFFYQVGPQDVTATRPGYKAKAGLIETALAVGFGRTFCDNWFIFSGASWRNLNWAANKNSPLVETRNNIGFILGIVWTFYESDERVKVKPDL